MANTPAQAIAKSKTITKGYKGLCLVFVRTCYGIGVKYPSAIAAWKGSKKRRTSAPPAGAPVFFTIPGNPYGHVALYLGGGKYRTNYSAKGTVITAALDHPVFAGMTKLGWTEDLNGVELDLNTAGAGYSKEIETWQRSMNATFPAYADFAVDGKYESYSQSVTKEFQSRVGLKRTGKLDAPTRTAMRKHGVKI